jgi:hypothetical protein
MGDRATSRILGCPDCGQDVMEAVSDGEMTNFWCVTCGACWRIELGWVSRVDSPRAHGASMGPTA